MSTVLPAVPRPSKVHLVPPRAAAAQLWYGWRNEPHAQRYMPIEPWSLDALRRRLVASMPDLSDLEKPEHRWLVMWQDEYVGIVGLHRPSFRLGHAEISYHLAEAHHRRGIATQAVSALCDRVFEETNLARLFAFVSENNRPSRRLLEKLGFVHEGTMREHFQIHGRRVDQCVYGILRREWLPRGRGTSAQPSTGNFRSS